jgi:hypothetical protein
MPDAEEWSQKFSQAADSATRGAGDPRPMLEVKKQFLIQLEKHRCKTHR